MGRGPNRDPESVTVTLPYAETDRAGADRLPALLLAIGAVVAETEIGAVVRTVVASAARLAEADYGAFALLGPDGEVADLVQHGLVENTRVDLQELPKAGGVLGLLVVAPDAVRIDDLAAEVSSTGLPPGHPAMRSLLGMPIRVRGRVFGVLYLTRTPSRPPFSAADELQVRALGAQASLAIANASASELGRRREEWLQTLTAVATGLFSGRELADVLPTVVRQARAIVDADFAAVALPTRNPAVLRLQYGDGVDAQLMIGTDVPTEASLAGTVLGTGKLIEIDDLRSDPRVTLQHELAYEFGPAIFVPLGGPSAVRGVLVAFNRPGRPAFEPNSVTMLDAFAAQVAVSLELADRRHDATRLALLEDRERIARDLHDVVIQRLFAIGLMLEGAGHSIADEDVGRRVSRAVDELDQTIKEIRTTIFGLQTPDGPEHWSLRARAVAVADQAVHTLGFVPSLRFEGPIDSTVPDRLSDQVVAVLREALSNAARHARASRVDVVLAVNVDELTLSVDDDGIGISGLGRRSGLANMEVRATTRGGRMIVQEREPRGTRLQWQVPLRGPAAVPTEAAEAS
jgi:signal transduction histidine kinase